MHCRTAESWKFKKKLEFKLHDVINTKQQTRGAIKEAFEGENMQIEYSFLSYRVDLYFHDYTPTIEVDEFGQDDRNIVYQIQKQKARQKEPGCVFIRTNPDEKNSNELKTITRIHRHIKKSSKKSLIDDLSKA